MALIRTCDLCKEPLQGEWCQVVATNFHGRRMDTQNTYDICNACYKKLEISATEIAFFESDRKRKDHHEETSHR